MEVSNLNFVFEHEIDNLIDQIKEELLIFLECPQDHLLIELICSDLDQLSLHSIELGLDDLHFVIKAFHDHLYLMNSCDESPGTEDVQTCIQDIKTIEKVLSHHRLAS